MPFWRQRLGDRTRVVTAEAGKLVGRKADHDFVFDGHDFEQAGHRGILFGLGEGGAKRHGAQAGRSTGRGG